MASNLHDHGPREGASSQSMLQRTTLHTTSLTSKALSYLAASASTPPLSHSQTSTSLSSSENGYPPLPEGVSNTQIGTSRQSAVSRAGPSSKKDETVLDIEACIDDPLLAPLGRHVHKRSTPRSTTEHVDINIVRPRDRLENDKDSHAPVTSLILRRRRLDRDQLDNHLKSLQPTLDPTLTKLQSPLLHLTELDLSRNRLASLPDDLTSLAPYLQYLNLSHNQLQEIPLSLCHLTNLQALIVSHNRLSGPIPHQIFARLTQLKTLRLCANQITELPHTLARLNKLETLILGSVYGGNLLTTFPPNCLHRMTSLLELDLSHNKLVFLPSDIGHPESRLRHLTATDNKIEVVPKSIGLCRHLKSLNLGRNQLTSLPTEIADLKQLDTLDLSENLLCIIPADIADFLTKTTLLLTGNPFTRGYCDAGRNASTALGGIGVNAVSDEERYSAVLHNLSRRAILNAATSSTSLPLYGHGNGSSSNLTSSSSGRVSPHPSIVGDPNYDMEHDERLDYHLYYTRHAMSSSRPPSRAESVQSLVTEAGDYGASHGGSWNDPHGTGSAGGTSTPRVNEEAFIHDLESYFERVLPSPRPLLPAAVATASAAATVASLAQSPINHHNTNNSLNLVFPEASLTTTASHTATASDESLSVSPPSASVTSSSSPQPDYAEASISSTAPPSITRSEHVTPVRPSVQVLPDASTSSPTTTTTTPAFFPSLKELSARTLLYHGQPLPLEYIPETVIEFLQPGARACGWCRQPYVKEWVSSICVKSYLGHPHVARRVRFCSLGCWHLAIEQSDVAESPSPAKAGTGLGLVTSPPSYMGSSTNLGLGIATNSPLTSLTGDNSSLALSAPDIPSVSSTPSSPPPLVLTRKDPTKRDLSANSHCADAGLTATGSQSMRVCKGGQTYWPVIARNPSFSLHDIEDAQTTKPGHSSNHGVCSGGCQGGGACEW
ncbi:Leucine-rich repeat serine/threonine-protein kinase 1 [Actinomortierella ambigua]|nr:Leucine-rich repeat serine/threonine-protein kinase 1 [Actinomortierella ambigua]